MCKPSGTPGGHEFQSPPSSDSMGLQLPDWVPPAEPCIAAFNLARANLPPAILNHSIRVFELAHAILQSRHAEKSYPALCAALNSKDLPNRLVTLWVACILHDLGCSTSLRSIGPQRFEVEGADAAASLLRREYSEFIFEEAEIHDVWVAIAVHSSPGIAERIGELARVVRRAVLIDFGGEIEEDEGKDSMTAQKRRLEAQFPRLGIEKVLGDVVVEQALSQPGGTGRKAPGGSWPGDLLRAKLAEPEWEGVNKGF